MKGWPGLEFFKIMTTLFNIEKISTDKSYYYYDNMGISKNIHKNLKRFYQDECWRK